MLILSKKEPQASIVQLAQPFNLSVFNLERLFSDHLAELRRLRAVFPSEVGVLGAVLLERHDRARRVALVAHREQALRRVELRLWVLEVEEGRVAVGRHRLVEHLLRLLHRAEGEPVLRAQMVEENEELRARLQRIAESASDLEDALYYFERKGFDVSEYQDHIDAILSECQ